MGDKVILLGTLVEVIQKYPASPGGAITEDTAAKSLRLDHPDFGDVAKTTFAKGVITDFEKIADDPIQVKSRVKVKIGDGEESDFIPIFFHPKEFYWDGEDGVLATDLDEETGAFKQAWMSFRCGDEVAVMLKEGVPVAVMGFADGKPRIGEDIVKVIAPHSDGTSRFFHLQCSKLGEDGLYGDLDEEKTGPDGLELGLTEENGPSPENYYQRPAAPLYPDSSGDARHFGTLSAGNCFVEVASIKQQYREFIFIVGPLLYVVQVLAVSSTVLQRNYPIGDLPWHYEPTDLSGMDPQMIVSAGDCPGPPGIEDAVTGPNAWFITDVQCRVGIYSEELLAAIEAQGPITAEEAYNNFINNGWNSEWGTQYPDTFWQSDSGIYNALASLFSFSTWPNWDETLFKVRPHNG